MRIALLAVGSRGDVQPVIALGAGLRERGHAVRLATDREFHPLAEEAGLEPLPLPGLRMKVTPGAATPLRFINALVEAMDRIAPELVAQTLAAAEGAELVIGTLLAHTEAMDRLSAPWCTMLFVPLMPTAAFPAPGFPELPLGRLSNRLTHVAAYQMLTSPLARRAGLAPKAIRLRWRDLGRARPALLAFSPTVVPPPSDWPPKCHVTGYWAWERAWAPGASLAAFVEREPRPVALTFGSLWPLAPSNAVEMVADCARRAGRRLVVVGGPDGQEGRQTGDVLHVPEVDHAWLFPRMAAVIHHGGAGTTAAVLHSGVPQIVVPCVGDQPFWAVRAQALGVAPQPIPGDRMSRERLEGAVAAALADPDIRNCAVRIGAALRAERGVERACEIIERYLASR